ncbi:hypothetical protein HOY34_17235 [Xinfangfangia sp. D13-10-4-6]|uniref:hypothetical protein n=1 Tax=Pseudogemmobacter hezensis TaxID=2737662 RepID=UPI001556FEEE|nr:hypothetical protein [Pseudogemmobacter hezensis]NPD16939.1 hypothetical protein [Pseudogemmobacter hezensis]
MASIEIDTARIGPIDIGEIACIDGYRKPSWLIANQGPLRLLIEAADKTEIHADLPRGSPEDGIEILQMAFQAIQFGRPGDDDEETLADLRAVLMRQRNRQTARRVA